MKITHFTLSEGYIERASFSDMEMEEKLETKSIKQKLIFNSKSDRNFDCSVIFFLAKFLKIGFKQKPDKTAIIRIISKKAKIKRLPEKSFRKT